MFTLTEVFTVSDFKVKKFDSSDYVELQLPDIYRIHVKDLQNFAMGDVVQAGSNLNLGSKMTGVLSEVEYQEPNYKDAMVTLTFEEDGAKSVYAFLDYRLYRYFSATLHQVYQNHQASSKGKSNV